jgi:ketosteroid isomerase-like protein
MTRSLVLACAAVAAIPRAARADGDADAIRAIVTEQAEWVGRDHGNTFVSHFASDAFAILPTGYGIGPADVAVKEQHAWCFHEGGLDASVDKIAIGRQGDVAWVTADLTYVESGMDAPPAKVPVRWTELLVRDGKRWVVHAMASSQTTPDRPADWAGQPLTDTAPGTDGAASPIAAWLKSPGELAKHLHKGDDVIVLGSAAGERGGGAGAAKLLASWKKLAFAIDWARAGGDGKTYGWIAARVSRTVKVKRDDVAEPYWALLLAVKSAGASDWEVVGVHYSQQLPADSDDAPHCD